MVDLTKREISQENDRDKKISISRIMCPEYASSDMDEPFEFRISEPMPFDNSVEIADKKMNCISVQRSTHAANINSLTRAQSESIKGYISDYMSREPDGVLKYAALLFAAVFAVPIMFLSFRTAAFSLSALVSIIVLCFFCSRYSFRRRCAEFQKAVDWQKYDVAVKRIKCLLPDNKVGFDDETSGKCLNSNDYKRLNEGDNVRVFTLMPEKLLDKKNGHDGQRFIFRI